jgi:hypothetical protein
MDEQHVGPCIDDVEDVVGPQAESSRKIRDIAWS